MTVEARFRRLRTLFDEAMDLPLEARDAFAAAQCADDSALHDELRRLLDCERDGPVLDRAAAGEALQRTLRDALPKAFLEGRQLGPFRIVEAIGGGGMGRVYRAVRSDGVVEQQVAIKFVRDGLFNPVLLERFSVERRALAALQHPNICRFLDTGQLDDGTPYVVMELVDGDSLFDWCDRRRLGVTARLQLLRKIVSAIAFAHRNLIVHRDIKSDNILVTADGEPVLLDFGIAKRLSPHDPDATATAQRFLTPANAAPEQLLGEAVGVGCDVYALGVLAYELLSGRPPFDLDGLTAGQIERMLTSVPPLPMSQRLRDADPAIAEARGAGDTRALARQLAGDLDAIVAHCLRKAAHERYPTVDKLDEDLERLLACRPVSVRQGHRRYRLRKFVQRHRMAVGLTVSLLLTVLLATVLLLRQTIHLQREQALASRERDRAERAVAVLTSAFLAADPSAANGGNTPVREVLKSANVELAKLATEQPGLYAALGSTMAEIEFKLGMEQVAAEIAERAADLSAAAPLPPVTEYRLRTLSAIGRAGAGEFPEAHQQLERARVLQPAPTAEWHLAESKVLRYEGRIDDAVVAADLAVAESAEREGDKELAIQACWQLSDVLLAANELARALAIADQCLATATAISDNSSRGAVVKSRLRRAQVLALLDRSSESLAEVALAISGASEAFGADSSLVAAGYSIQAQSLTARRKWKAAAESQRRALEIWRLRFGDGHFNTVRTAFQLAEALAHMPEGAAEAEALYREVVAATERTPRHTLNQSAHFRARLAHLLNSTGDHEQALRTLSVWLASHRTEALAQPNEMEFREELLLACRGIATESSAGEAVDPIFQNTCGAIR